MTEQFHSGLGTGRRSAAAETLHDTLQEFPALQLQAGAAVRRPARRPPSGQISFEAKKAAGC